VSFGLSASPKGLVCNFENEYLQYRLQYGVNSNEVLKFAFAVDLGFICRRRQLAQLGSASGVFRTLVKYLVGCPQVRFGHDEYFASYIGSILLAFWMDINLCLGLTGFIGFRLQNQRWPWVCVITCADLRRLGSSNGILRLFHTSMHNVVLQCSWWEVCGVGSTCLLYPLQVIIEKAYFIVHCCLWDFWFGVSCDMLDFCVLVGRWRSSESDMGLLSTSSQPLQLLYGFFLQYFGLHLIVKSCEYHPFQRALPLLCDTLMNRVFACTKCMTESSVFNCMLLYPSSDKFLSVLQTQYTCGRIY